MMKCIGKKILVCRMLCSDIRSKISVGRSKPSVLSVQEIKAKSSELEV